MLRARHPIEPQRAVKDCYRAFRSTGDRGVVLRPARPGTAAVAVLEPSARVDWGRDSAEARRLAWMLLHDASGSERLADDWHDSFAEEVVERLPDAGFVLTRDEIMAWLDSSP